MTINTEAVEAQLAAQKVKIDQLRAEHKLKLQQVDQLKVRAGADGILQALPTPVEVGQKVAAGHRPRPRWRSPRSSRPS